MNQSDIDLAGTLRLKAGKDLSLALKLINDSEQTENCGFHLQQAAEKAIKAMLIGRGAEYETNRRLGHDLEYLTGLLITSGFKKLDLELLCHLQPYAVMARYDVYEDRATELKFSDMASLIKKLIACIDAELKRL